MKNITRRGFLQLGAAAALVCAAAPLTGCEGRKILKNLYWVTGTWKAIADWSTQYMMMEAVRFGVVWPRKMVDCK